MIFALDAIGDRSFQSKPLQWQGQPVSREAFDIELGWDLVKKSSQQSILSYLRTEKPGLVIISPPCTKFSNLTHLNLNLRSKSRGALKEHTEELRRARELLQFAVKVCLVCLELGLSCYTSIHGQLARGRRPVYPSCCRRIASTWHVVTNASSA